VDEHLVIKNYNNKINHVHLTIFKKLLKIRMKCLFAKIELLNHAFTLKSKSIGTITPKLITKGKIYRLPYSQLIFKKWIDVILRSNNQHVLSKFLLFSQNGFGSPNLNISRFG